MALLESLLDKLKAHPKRIVFPEGEDPRIIQTARQLATHAGVIPVLLGDRSDIKSRAARLDIRLEGIRLMEPERSDDFELFVPMLDNHPRFGDLSAEAKRTLILDRHNFAALMLETARVDALVAGATLRASSGLRSLFRLIPKLPGVDTASSMLILDQEKPTFGTDGLLFLADCGVLPEPNAEQLADIAVATADMAAYLTNTVPRVAFLSYATHARQQRHPSIPKIREALERARRGAHERGLEAVFDGEMQVDAALRPDVAEQKGLQGSPVAGQANVLIFPDLNSGNIAAKMLQVVAQVRTYGQIITGLSRPCAEISRGAHLYDIFGTAVITAARALDRRMLFGTEPVQAVPPLTAKPRTDDR